MIKGIGIDLVEVERIRQAIKRQGKRFLERVFTQAEIKYCLKHKRLPYPHFAARFAAKEAFLKAIGTGWGTKTSPQWTEIEIKSKEHRAKSIPMDIGTLYALRSTLSPEIILKGKALQHIRKLKAKRIHLSMTHTSSYASAIIILEG